MTKCYTFTKNKREEVHVTLAEFKGHKMVDLRAYFKTEDMAEAKPTQKGLCVNIDKLDHLIAGLRAAREEALKLGWVNMSKLEEELAHGGM